MASSDGDSTVADGKDKGVFPQVHFRDDDPKKGFTTIQLSIPSLKIKKLPFKDPQANADISVTLDTGLVDVKVTMNDDSAVYVYRKSLPADIYPLRSKYTVSILNPFIPRIWCNTKKHSSCWDDIKLLCFRKASGSKRIHRKRHVLDPLLLLKHECVKLSLAKANATESWTPHAKYFMHKSTNQSDLGEKS